MFSSIRVSRNMPSSYLSSYYLDLEGSQAVEARTARYTSSRRGTLAVCSKHLQIRASSLLAKASRLRRSAVHLASFGSCNSLYLVSLSSVSMVLCQVFLVITRKTL